MSITAPLGKVAALPTKLPSRSLNARIARMAKSQSAKLRARKIKLILFDVDGVLTDGKLFFVPAPPGLQLSTQQHAAQHGGEGGFGIASSSMIEIKGFHAHDGTAISLARLAGIKTGLIPSASRRRWRFALAI